MDLYRSTVFDSKWSHTRVMQDFHLSIHAAIFQRQRNVTYSIIAINRFGMTKSKHPPRV